MPDVSLSGIEFTIKGNADSASSSVAQLTSQLNKLKAALSSTSGVQSMSKGIKQVGDEAKKQSAHTNKFFSSILRIAGYRMIRGALKAITSAFSEGLKNAYQFSKAMNNAGGLAHALDSISTASLQMKNQMGAAFGGLITAIYPIAVQIIHIVNAVAAAITRLIAILGGKSTWLRAKENWTEWGEAASGAGGAAKEALKYLAPFDELNRLPDENKGGGGGGGDLPDYSSMFEEVSTDVGAGLLDSITEAFGKLRDWFLGKDWQDIGSQAWETLKTLFADEGKATELVNTLFSTLGAQFGAMAGFAWGFLKDAVSDIFHTFKQNIQDYNGNDKIDISDILHAAWNTTSIGLRWIEDNVLVPFMSSFKQAAFGWEPSEDPVTLSDWLDKLFDPITWEKAKQWVIDHIWQPLVDAVREVFSGEGLLGGISLFGDGTGTAEFDVKATLTELVDKIPSAQKAIDAVANFTKRTLSGSMEWNSGTGKGRIFDSVARFTTRTFGDYMAWNSGKGKGRIFSAVANFTSRTFGDYMSWNSGKGKGRIFSAVANFTTRTFGEKMAWNNGKGPGRIFGAVANFIKGTQGYSNDNAPSSNAYASFFSGYQGYETRYAPSLYAYAALFDPYWANGTPTMSVYVSATSAGGHSGLYGTFATGGAYYSHKWHDIPQYASGTSNAHGSLFIAGEAGAELVGHIGGRTEVLNQSQIASTMYAAVRSAMGGATSSSGMTEEELYRTFLRALNDADNDRPIELDGNTLYHSMVNRNRANTRLTGVNALA